MNAKVKAQFARVEAAIEDMKVKLAKDVATLLDETGMTQTEASYITGEAPSQLSLICTGKLRGFSLERLIRVRAMLGAHVELVVKSTGTAKVTLKVA